MGLFKKFDDYKASRKRSQIEKAAKTITNAKAIKEDRFAALEYFAEEVDDPEIAVKGLLPRFEYSLEHGIADTREKELATKGILRHGKAALPILTQWIRSTNKIAWPIKILKEIGTAEEVVESLKSALNFTDVSFDQAAVDKNYDILCYLRDHKLSNFIGELKHFLNDPDERVRFSCVEVLIEQEADSIPPLLERFLSDTSAENTRLRQSVLNAFIRNHWKVANTEAFGGGMVAPGVKLNADGSLSGGVAHQGV